MISRVLFGCLVAALLGTTPSVAGQEVGPPDDLVDALTSGARINLPKAILPDGSNVPAESPEELARPIVPRSLEVQTIERALLSATMEICKLDSNSLSFLPYMGRLRDSNRYSEKQLAYIGVLHDFSIMWLSESIDPSICNDDVEASMVREAAEGAIATP